MSIAFADEKDVDVDETFIYGKTEALTSKRQEVNAADVLIVEDNDDSREMLCMVIESMGYHVSCACNGREALKRLETDPPPCLIILDLMMPVMTGWEFREEQLKNPEWASIPVYVVSALADRTSLEGLHPQGYFNKPIEINSLLEGLKRFCS